MSTPVLSCIPAYMREWPCFSAQFRALPEEAWDRPTYCEGWSAADVVGHLTLGAWFYTEVVSAGVEGRVEPPFGAKSAEEFNEKRISIMKEIGALPPPARLDRFEAENAKLEKIFLALEPADLEKNGWHRFGPCPIRFYPIARLSELILHEWDVRNEPEADVLPHELEAAAEALPWRSAFFHNLRKGGDIGAPVRIRVTEPDMAFGIACRDGKAEAVPAEGGDFAAEVSIGAGEFILLSSGRADPAAKEAAGRLRIEGDRAPADKLLEVLSRPF